MRTCERARGAEHARIDRGTQFTGARGAEHAQLTRVPVVLS